MMTNKTEKVEKYTIKEFEEVYNKANEQEKKIIDKIMVNSKVEQGVLLFESFDDFSEEQLETLIKFVDTCFNEKNKFISVLYEKMVDYFDKFRIADKS